MRGRIAVLILLGLCCLPVGNKLAAAEYVVKDVIEFYGLPDLSPGDVVILKNGVWENSFLEFEGTGTESQPITLRAETAGEVILTGNSGLEIGGEYLVVEGLTFTQGAKSNGQIIAFRSSSSKHAYHCRLTNTKIIDFNPTSKTTEYKWVSLYGQHNRVDHCHFEGKNHEGATLVVWLDGRETHHRIDSNYFGPRPELGFNGGETIRIGTSDWSMSDSYTIVEGNLFDGCDGEIEIISNKSCKNIYRNNTFIDSEGTLTLRHGNECEVYGNFFFGAPDKRSGGIRIIGEDHKVYNNYLQDLSGDGFRSAITMTNGVPDSPLNRYFQVKNAMVVNNTIVNCKYPFTIGAGVSSELSLPPVDCFIANNVAVDYSSNTNKMIDYDAEPENMSYLSNIMYGAELGIPSQAGILEEDPALILKDLWRPADTSIAIAYGVDTFSYVVQDIDGQLRESTNDAGCDQLSSEPIIYRPLTKEDVGVSWASSIKEVTAEEGGQVLKAYIDSAKNGDVIILTTSGGIYQMDSGSVLSADISIRAAYDLEQPPLIEASGSVEEFVILSENAELQIEGINFMDFGAAFRTSSSLDANDTLELTISNCQFRDLKAEDGGYLLESRAPAFFSQLHLTDVQIFDVGYQAIFFEDLSYAEELHLSNCTFVNIGRQAVRMNAPAQGDAIASLDHCTLDSVGSQSPGYEMLSLVYADAMIRNSLFTNSAGETSVSISGVSSTLDYCLFWRSGEVDATDGAVIGTSVIREQDVAYSDRSRYYFSLLPGSPALGYASDGENLGDLYWNDHGILSDNAYLSMIRVDGEDVAGFEYDSFVYDAMVIDPSDYVVTVITQDTAAKAVITYPGTLPGVCVISVTAENGVDTQTYGLNLSPLNNTTAMEIGGEAIHFYPNPSDDILVIESEVDTRALLYDMCGRLVREFIIDEPMSTYSLAELPSGYYHMYYRSATKTGSKKLLIL